MPISNKIKSHIEKASWIRKMFEEGNTLRQQYGAENVFDFTLGNPTMEPPEELHQELKRIADQPIPGMHRYMNNAGYDETRTAVAEAIAENCGLPGQWQPHCYDLRRGCGPQCRPQNPTQPGRRGYHSLPLLCRIQILHRQPGGEFRSK